MIPPDVFNLVYNVRFYETRNDPGNIWRVYGLRRAIGVLRNCTERIDTYDKAIRFSSIGDPTARKIAEIASTGDLRRVGMMQTQEDRWTEIFLKVRLFRRHCSSSELKCVVPGLWCWSPDSP